VAWVKLQIEQQTGIPVAKQILKLSGKAMVSGQFFAHILTAICSTFFTLACS
jgi:hypothetical protein